MTVFFALLTVNFILKTIYSRDAEWLNLLYVYVNKGVIMNLFNVTEYKTTQNQHTHECTWRLYVSCRRYVSHERDICFEKESRNQK